MIDSVQTHKRLHCHEAPYSRLQNPFVTRPQRKHHKMNVSLLLFCGTLVKMKQFIAAEPAVCAWVFFVFVCVFVEPLPINTTAANYLTG